MQHANTRKSQPAAVNFSTEGEIALTNTLRRRSSFSATKMEWKLFILCLIVVDALLTLLAFQTAYIVRFKMDLPFFKETIFTSPPFYNSYMITVLPIWVTTFAALGLYNKTNLLGGTFEYSTLFTATTFGMFVNIVARFAFTDSLILARGWVIMAWILAFLFTATGRFILRRVAYRLRANGYFQKPAVLIGINEEGRLLAEQIMNSTNAGIRIVGYMCHNETDCEASSHVRYLGEIPDLDKLIEKYEVDVLIMVSSALSQEQVLSVFRRFGMRKDIELRMSSGLYEIITTGMTVKEEGLVPLVVINKVRFAGVDLIMKNLLDYSMAIFALIVLFPILLVIAVIVKLDSPGPIFYRRRVMGMNGKQFDAFKFRTMDQRSDEMLSSNPDLMKEYLENFKIKDDPRITRIGKFLRKTSLDELPQLFNVLRNEMSIAGPRMITPQELSKYNKWDINLLTVKPGITGMWQVGGRSDVSYEERVRMDMYYIRNWTIWLDIQIIIQTIPAVLTKKGAY